MYKALITFGPTEEKKMSFWDTVTKGAADAAETTKLVSLVRHALLVCFA